MGLRAWAPTSNLLQEITGSLPRTYGYDAAGNTTGYAGAVLSYDNRGRMTSATYGPYTAAYIYNAVGQRVKRVGPTGTTLYAYDEQGHLLGEYDGSGALIQETVWVGDIPVATLRPNGAQVEMLYVHTDHLNTPRIVTRPADNAVRWRWDSDPFGKDVPNENPSGLGVFRYDLRFPGQQYDGMLGLFYNYFRDYDPGTGRYVESDPIGLRGGLNTFGYVDGNPISRVDPKGDSWLWVIGAVAAYQAIDVGWNMYQLQDCIKKCVSKYCNEDGTYSGSGAVEGDTRPNLACRQHCNLKIYGTPNGPGPFWPASR